MGQDLAFSDSPDETVYAPTAGARLDATPLDRTPTGPESLTAIPGLWRGNALARVALESLPTGYAALDAQLPGGGWPLGALTEILGSETGIGELRLFFPALAKLAGGKDAPPIILLQPPYAPYAPAFAGAGINPAQVLVLRTRKLEDALWACEQCLKYAPRGAVFAWPKQLAQQDLRRLQLAVEGRPVLAVLMREPKAAQQSSAAALRIALAPGIATRGSLSLRILKRRGGLLERSLLIEPPSPLPATPLPTSPLIQPNPAHPKAEASHALDRAQPAATTA
jgi:protein ImuA